MANGGKSVVILFDLSTPPPEDHDYSDLIKGRDWESERSVFRSLQHLGYEPVLVGVCDDIHRLVCEIKRIKPAFVFNMTEAFRNCRDYEAQVAGVLDLLSIPYTGTKTLGLSICQDKGLCKKILAHHRIRVPKWVSSRAANPVRGLKNFAYPAFVKLAREEASVGISRDSLVYNEKDCLDRIHFLHDRFKSDVIVEEFIPGREFYVSIMGHRRPEVFPIRELCFREFPDDAPKFATFKSKWDDDYRRRWGIRTEFARGLSEEQTNEMCRIAKKAFDFLYLSGYARLDVRLSETGEIVVLEANPNPALSVDDDFALSAMKVGYKYDEVIERIVSLAH